MNILNSAEIEEKDGKRQRERVNTDGAFGAKQALFLQGKVGG